ncbi:MAG: ATP-binding cassette domain-containing protein [Oscillospiraceae bacterium]
MDKAIVVDKLCKKYKNGRGIEDISFSVEEGEIFGFLGPNGAGKTTAIKIMTGLLKAERGDVFIDGYSISKNYENAMAKIGAIVEAVTPFSYLTAFENMKMTARYYDNIDNKRINECLEIVGLTKFAHEKSKNFSLGMKQRLGIAVAILSNPNILILDEPLNGLDVEGMVDMRNLFQKLSEKYETTLLISSHLIHDVELTCNKIGVLYGGKMLNVDSTANILKNYSSLENYYLSEVGTNAND